MNRDQYFDRHRNLNIEREMLERKWRAYREEQELMEQMRLFEAARASSSSAAAAGAGGGFVPPEDKSSLTKQDIFHIFTLSTKDNWQVLVSNHTDNDFKLVDLGISKLSNYYSYRISSERSIMLYGQNNHTDGTFWVVFIGPDGSLETFDGIQATNNQVNTRSNDGFSIVFGYRPNGTNIYRYHYTFSGKVYTSEINIVGDIADGYPYLNYFNGSDCLSDGTFTSYYSVDTNTGYLVFLFRPDGSVIELKDFDNGDYVSSKGMFFYGDYMFVLYTDPLTDTFKTTRIYQKDGTYTDYSFPFGSDYRYWDVVLYGTNKFFIILNNTSTDNKRLAFYDKVNGITYSDESLYRDYNFITNFLDGIYDISGSPQEDENALIWFFNSGVMPPFLTTFGYYNNIQFLWKKGNSSINSLHEAGAFYLGYLDSVSSRVLCKRNSSEDLESLYFGNSGYSYTSTGTPWDGVRQNYYSYTLSSDKRILLSWVLNAGAIGQDRITQVWEGETLLDTISTQSITQYPWQIFYENNGTFVTKNPSIFGSTNKLCVFLLEDSSWQLLDDFYSGTSIWDYIQDSQLWYLSAIGDGGVGDKYDKSGLPTSTKSSTFIVFDKDSGKYLVIYKGIKGPISYSPIPYNGEDIERIYLTDKYLIYLISPEKYKFYFKFYDLNFNLVYESSVINESAIPLDTYYLEVVNDRFSMTILYDNANLIVYQIKPGSPVKQYEIGVKNYYEYMINDMRWWD